MGEYATGPTGRRIKLGTCEDLWYVTRADVRELSRRGWKDDDGQPLSRSYLGGSYRYRLDRQEQPGVLSIIESREHTDPGVTVPIDDEVQRLIRTEVAHHQIALHRGGVNFFVPCPYGSEWESCNIRHSPIPECRQIEIVAEGAEPRRAVFRCPFCEALFNLHGTKAAASIAESVIERVGPRSGRQAAYLAGLCLGEVCESEGGAA